MGFQVHISKNVNSNSGWKKETKLARANATAKF